MGKGKRGGKGNKQKNFRKDGTTKGTPHQNKYANGSKAESEAAKMRLGMGSTSGIYDTLQIVQEVAEQTATRKNYRRQAPYQSQQRPGSFRSLDNDISW